MSKEKASSNATNQPLINEDNFESLRNMQRRIADATGISPSVRIIINKLINDEQLGKVETLLIEQLKGLENM